MTNDFTGNEDALTETDVDILVLGGGMSGLTTAACAAERGASVGVVEVAAEPGGSAAMSGGFVYTAPTVELFLDEDPQGDVARFETLLEWYGDGFDWVQKHGVSGGPVQDGIKGFGRGRQIDIHHYLRRMQVSIESRRGWIARRTQARELLVEDGRVVGAKVEALDTGEIDEIRAGATVLATGGFQASAELRAKHLAPHGEDVVVRSNPYSVGDGLALGQSAGGALTPEMGGYYGHLIPYPLNEFEEPDYVTLAQYHSEHGLLLDKDGRRFVDESLGDHVGTQEVGHRRSSLMLIDNRVLRDHVLAAYMSGLAGLDKLAEGGKRGAHYAVADTLEGVLAMAAQWGYDADQGLRTVQEFNDHVAKGQGALDPPRKRFRKPLLEPPFSVLEVQSGITFTYGGLVTDLKDRVLDVEGNPVSGLFAIGADAGGLNHRGYTGGLIRGLVLGLRLGELLTPDRVR
jgi:succinate dehydrogenase/fumarate reductase flavoprotein subunit